MEFIPWDSTCICCRIGAIFLSGIACLSFVFNMRFLFLRGFRNHFVFSLILASMLILMISIPGMLIQLFTCHRHCVETYCQIEGFTSYLSGCLCMLTLMMLAIHRYLKMNSPDTLWKIEYSNCFCWFFSSIFTFPLVFKYFNSYLPEGLGFHCSIDWQDQSTISRYYIATSFVVLYLIPLICLTYFSFRVDAILRHVNERSNYLYSISNDSNQTSSSDTTARRAVSSPEGDSQSTTLVRLAKDRQRFKINTQYLRAIVILIGNYVCAWTPYSIVAILQLMKIDLIFRYSYLITFTALIGKFSVILTPLIYIRLMNKTLFRRLLF